MLPSIGGSPSARIRGPGRAVTVSDACFDGARSAVGFAMRRTSLLAGNFGYRLSGHSGQNSLMPWLCHPFSRASDPPSTERSAPLALALNRLRVSAEVTVYCLEFFQPGQAHDQIVAGNKRSATASPRQP